MMKNVLLSLVAVVPLLGMSSAIAATQKDLEVAQNPESRPMQQEQQQPQNVEFQRPTATGEGVVGRVYDVVGDVVLVDLENGGTREIYLSKGDRGQLGHLIGQRVVVSGNSLRQQIALAPSPIVATPIASTQRTETTITQQQTSQTVEQQQEQQQQVVTPEATPAPAPAPAPAVPAPAPAPAPAATPRVIPQTW